MDFEDHSLQARLSAFLRAQYPSDQIGRLSTDINCDQRTAKNILGKHWPSARHLRAIVKRFGQDVLDAVFAPDIDSTLAQLRAEERKLEERLERARAHRRQVEGAPAGVPSPVAAPARQGAAQ